MTVFRQSLVRLTLAVAGLAFAGAAAAVDITGAGATFPEPVYKKWADGYKKETGVGLNYQGIGSSGGIKQIKANTVTFGASDKPLSPADLESSGLIQWPQILGGIVAIVNIDGVEPGQLILDGKALADIFEGRITKWDDKKIAALNPKLKLPSKAILIVRRADGSGTTFNFTSYLSKVSESWRVNVGADNAVSWPVDGVAGKGNPGVANLVKQTKNSIGYVEFAYAKQNKLAHTLLINKDGKTVAPSSESFQAAAAGAEWAKAKAFELILVDQPGPNSWPITAASLIIVPKASTKPDELLAALKFFNWAFKSGGPAADELDYVPLPADVVALIEKTWKASLKDASGAPLWK